MIQMEQNTTQKLELYKKIPERVKCHVPLKVDISDISGAGRGVFVRKDVKQGDLIFSIAKPLIYIANDGEEMLWSTCDNCFAYCSGGVTMVSRENLNFMACGRCKVLYYCSKASLFPLLNFYLTLILPLILILFENRTVKSSHGSTTTNTNARLWPKLKTTRFMAQTPRSIS